MEAVVNSEAAPHVVTDEDIRFAASSFIKVRYLFKCVRDSCNTVNQHFTFELVAVTLFQRWLHRLWGAALIVVRDQVMKNVSRMILHWFSDTPAQRTKGQVVHNLLVSELNSVGLQPEFTLI